MHLAGSLRITDLIYRSGEILPNLGWSEIRAVLILYSKMHMQ